MIRNLLTLTILMLSVVEARRGGGGGGGRGGGRSGDGGGSLSGDGASGAALSAKSNTEARYAEREGSMFPEGRYLFDHQEWQIRHLVLAGLCFNMFFNLFRTYNIIGDMFRGLIYLFTGEERVPGAEELQEQLVARMTNDDLIQF